MKRLLFPFFIVSLVAVLLLAGCQPSAQGGATEAAATQEAAPGPVSVSPDILLDPALATDEDSLAVGSYIYEGLVRLEANQVAPALAVSWTVSEDELDYIINLRPGVAFHDGMPFNADAVIANFNRWFDPADALHGSAEYPAWVAAFIAFKGELDSSGKPRSTYDGIEKVDDLTVLIHLNTPDSNMLFKLTNPAFGIASPTALAADGANYGTQAGSAVGTGPYVLASWTADGLTLEPNSDYWNADAIPANGLEIGFSQ